MKAVVFGADGQLGNALQHTAPKYMEIVAARSSDCDIRHQNAVRGFVSAHEPDVLINAAAYTAVDRAESEPDLAYAVNAKGPENLAVVARQAGIRVVHVSTDFVFDGTAESPIQVDAKTSPLGVYGESKLAGERALLNTYPEGSAIVRTSWVYGAHGGNFVKTMLRLMAEKDEISVVSDQVGSPTWTASLAIVLWKFAVNPTIKGIFHWSDAGVISWFEFAKEIQRQALELGLLAKEIPIHPISTEQYPTPARRPKYSVLDCSTTIDAIKYAPAPWADNLHKMLTELSH